MCPALLCPDFTPADWMGGEGGKKGRENRLRPLTRPLEPEARRKRKEKKT